MEAPPHQDGGAEASTSGQPASYLIQFNVSKKHNIGEACSGRRAAAASLPAALLPVGLFLWLWLWQWRWL